MRSIPIIIGMIAAALAPEAARAGCRCEGETSITLFINNAACETECRSRGRAVAVWPDPGNSVGRAIAVPGAANGVVGGVGSPPRCQTPPPPPPEPIFRERARVGGIPFTIRGTRAHIDAFKANLERFRSDCLGARIWRALSERLGGAMFDDGMQVFLDDGSRHAACQTGSSDRDTFAASALGVYDGYGVMYDAWARACGSTSSSGLDDGAPPPTSNILWMRAGAGADLGSPDSLETFAHELTHAAYDMEDGFGLREGEYCAHLAGWMVGSRLAPFPRPAMRLERSLFGPLMEEGTCSIGNSWRQIMAGHPSIEGRDGKLATYLSSCGGSLYPEDRIFPSRDDSTTCGATNSSCCPFQPQPAGCRESWEARTVTGPTGAPAAR